MTTTARHLGRLATAVALAACLALAAFVLVPASLGLDRYVITSGSMGGDLGPGAIALAERTPVERLRTGDVITYAPPPGSAPSALVTHRITAFLPGPDGRRTFRTKGDANAAPDPWVFQLDAATQPRVVLAVPHAGWALIVLADRTTRMLLLGLPALLIALLTFVRLGRDVRADALATRVGAVR